MDIDPNIDTKEAYMSQHDEPQFFVVALELDEEFFELLEECLFPDARGSGVASRPAMSGGTLMHWKAIRVEGAAPGRTARLAALCRFQNGDLPEGVSLFDEAHAAVTDPGAIDWAGFPVVDALEAVVRDELERMNHLFRAGGPASVRRKSRGAALN
jgi:hypothetical protein